MNNRYSIIFALLAFAGLLYLAAEHFLIRGIFLESSVELFSMLKNGGFDLEGNRYAAISTQLLPFAFIKSGADLPSIILYRSLSPILYYMVLYAILYFGLKKKGLAWGLLMSLVIMAGSSFYWTASYLLPGLAFVFVVLGVWDFKRKESQLNWFAFAALVPLSVFLAGFHPIVFYAWLGAGAYILIANTWYKNWQDWLVFGLVAGLLFLRNTVLPFNPSVEEPGLLGSLAKALPRFWELPSLRDFIVDSIFKYYILTLCLFSLTWYWLHRKRWFSAIWIWVSYFGYLLVVSGGNPEAGKKFYHEDMLLVLGFLVSLPWGQELVPHVLQSRFYKFIFIFILGARLLHIQTNHLAFERHMRFYEEQIEAARSNGFQKVILTDMDKAEVELVSTWASSLETLILSSLSGPEESLSIIVIYNEESWGDDVDGSRLLLTEWGTYPVEDLPHQYFQVGGQPYTVVQEAW